MAAIVGAMDPGWLLSTAAQSTAVLVAIVGGFLVSRLLTLASERSAAARSVREAGNRVNYQRQRSQRLVSEITGEDAFDLLHSSDVKRALVTSRGMAAADELVTTERRSGLTPELFDSIIAPARSAIERAWDAVTVPEEVVTSAEGFVEWNGLTSEDPDAEWFALVYRHVNERRPGGLLSAGLGIDVFNQDDTLGMFLGERQLDRWDQKLHDRDEAIVDLHVAEAELKQARAEEASLAAHENVWLAFGILSYFALVGLVIPLCMLAAGPNLPNLTARVVVAVLFISGLVALLGLFAKIILTALPTKNNLQQ